MLAIVLAGLLLGAAPDGLPPAVSAGSDATVRGEPRPPAMRVRVPGLRFDLGESLGDFDSTGVFSPFGAGAGRVGRRGPCRYFGLDGEASLRFADDRLVSATLIVQALSPHSLDYIEDQLRALGYRRRCERIEPMRRDCEWDGPLRISMDVEGGRLSAVASANEPVPEAQALAFSGAAASRPARADSADSKAAPVPMLAETLVVGRANAERPAPVVLDRAALDRPMYPASARSEGVQGVVLTLALVDTSGTVMEAGILRGIRELDAAALDLVRALRFGPETAAGRACRFRVVVPVVYTLH